jgi:DnaJ domain
MNRKIVFFFLSFSMSFFANYPFSFFGPKISESDIQKQINEVFYGDIFKYGISSSKIDNWTKFLKTFQDYIKKNSTSLMPDFEKIRGLSFDIINNVKLVRGVAGGGAIPKLQNMVSLEIKVTDIRDDLKRLNSKISLSAKSKDEITAAKLLKYLCSALADKADQIKKFIDEVIHDGWIIIKERVSRAQFEALDLTTSKPTIYDILKINPKASSNEIKSSFKRLMIKWHPDKNPGQEDLAKDVSQLINTAYERALEISKSKIYEERTGF